MANSKYGGTERAFNAGTGLLVWAYSLDNILVTQAAVIVDKDSLFQEVINHFLEVPLFVVINRHYRGNGVGPIEHPIGVISQFLGELLLRLERWLTTAAIVKFLTSDLGKSW